MKVNYFLKDKNKKKTSIEAIVRYKGARYKFNPRVSVEVKHWDQETKRAELKKEYPEGDLINIILDRHESQIKAIFAPYLFKRVIPSPEQIKADLANTTAPQEKKTGLFLPFYKIYYENADYKLQTWKKYNTTYNWLLRYEKQFNTKLSFSAIDMEFYENFRHWVLTKTYVRIKGDTPRNYSINYFGSLVKCIKKVMGECGPQSRLKLHNNTEYNLKEFKTEHEAADSVYLSVEEIKKIHAFIPTVENIGPITKDLRVENRLRKVEALKLAKNKFLIGCFTALRVSDFNRLREVNIHDNLIRIKPQKGTRKNEDVVIPIHPIIKEILNTGYNLATEVSDQKINKHIKEVCQLVGINQPVTVARTEGGKLVERTQPKYKLVTTHTARRSGATNMFLAGIPGISIMKITGHTTERSFLKYIRVSQEENARLLADHPFFNK